MRQRVAIALTPALLAGSILAGCAGFGATTTTIVAPSPAAPGGSDLTTYTGTTEQGLPFVFAGTPTTVVELTFDWRAPCADGHVRSNSIRLGAASVRNGSFSFDSTLETGGVTQVEGQIQGDNASGTFSRSKGTAFGIDCAVSGVHWEARAASGSGENS